MKTLIPICFFLLPLFLFFTPSLSITIIFKGLSEWNNPSIYVGDTLIFKHKLPYNLYIFNHKTAFQLCNLTQATLLNEPNSSSFMWIPTRAGFFYFSFINKSLAICGRSEKIAIRVFSKLPEASAFSPEYPPAASPSPTSGGGFSSTPSYHWPFFRSHQANSPAPAPASATPANIPSVFPDSGGGIPFINSNPAVPLPTGESDAATIRPLPTSGDVGKVDML